MEQARSFNVGPAIMIVAMVESMLPEDFTVRVSGINPKTLFVFHGSGCATVTAKDIDPATEEGRYLLQRKVDNAITSLRNAAT